MEKNIGRTDQIIRSTLGILIIMLGIMEESWLGIIGLIPLLTAFINRCPLYPVFGIDTFGDCGGDK